MFGFFCLKISLKDNKVSLGTNYYFVRWKATLSLCKKCPWLILIIPSNVLTNKDPLY